MNLTRKYSLVGKTIKSINLKDPEDMSNDFLGQPCLYIQFTDDTEAFITYDPCEESFTLTEDGRDGFDMWDRLCLNLITRKEYEEHAAKVREEVVEVKLNHDRELYIKLKKKFEKGIL